MSDANRCSPGDTSHSDNPITSFPFIERIDEDSAGSAPDSCLAIVSVKESVKDSPDTSDDTSANELDPISSNCQLCLTTGALKNKVRRTTPDERDAFRCVGFDDVDGSWFPFSIPPASHNSQQSRSDSFLIACQRCIRLFRRFAKAESDEVVSAKRTQEIAAEKRRFIDRRKKKLVKPQGTSKNDRQCFMVRKGTLACSASTDNIYRPTHLRLETKAVKDILCDLFATRNNVAPREVQEIMSNPDHVRLCNVHKSLLRSCLLKIKNAERLCSVCTEYGTSRNPKTVVRFPWKRISADEDMVCVVEDALAVFKGPGLRPRDLKYICDPCRRVVLRDVSMRTNVVRDQVERSDARKPRTRIDYGPTPVSIRKCIKFVRGELEKRGTYVVFLKTVRKQYEIYLCQAKEETRRLKDDRSLKKYTQPSLAATGIHLMLGPFKLGSFFCTTTKFIELAEMAKTPSYAPLAMAPDVEGALYDQFDRYIKDRGDDISKSTWELCDFVRAVSKLLWWGQVELLWGSHLKKRCRSVAALRKTSYEEQWPCNPLLCPNDMRGLPNHEFTFILSVYFSI